MSKIATIALGGRTYSVRRLTIGQLREIGIGTNSAADVLAKTTAAERETAAYDAMISTISAALRRDHPEITAQSILEIETDFAELRDAHRAVLELAGLLPAGEAKAASSDGATSTGS